MRTEEETFGTKVTHDVSGGHPEVDGDGGERERRPGALGLVDPAAERLQGGGAMLKLLPQRQEQKQDINTAASQELGHHWTNPKTNIDIALLISFSCRLEYQVVGQVFYLGAGTNTWTAISSTSRMNEQTMLDLKSSSLIWENWGNENTPIKGHWTSSAKGPGPPTGSPYLSLHVGVLEHLSESRDVLFPHPLAAPDLHGLADPLVDLAQARALHRDLIGQLCQRAVGEGGEDLQNIETFGVAHVAQEKK